MINRITQINEVNIEYYLPLLPSDFPSRLSDERTLAFGIESLGYAAGAAIVRLVSFKAEIEWFFVSEIHRGIGVGSESLLNLLSLLHKKYNIKEVYMDFFAGTDENLSKLFNSFPNERTPLPQCVFKTTLGQLLSSDKISGSSKHCISLAELDSSRINKFCNEIVMRGMDFVPMPVDPAMYYKEQSAVFMEDGEPKGMLLYKKTNEDIEVSFLVSLTDNSAAIPDMIHYSVEKFKRFGEDTAVSINVIEPKIKAIVKNLLSMDKNDESGFIGSERITLDLSFLDEAEADARMMMETWKKYEKDHRAS